VLCGENGTTQCETVQASSFSDEYTSDKAVDGNLQTCSKPAYSLNDSWWWRLDLHEFRTVEQLSLVFDASQTENNYSIYVNNLTSPNNYDTLGSLCANPTTVLGANKTHVSCEQDGLVGRFVHVIFPQSVVSLCEIQVFETNCRTCPPNTVVAAGHNVYKDCNCPDGAYVADNRCEICPVGKTTQQNSEAVRLSDCVLCAFGYDPGDHSCKRCDVGFVKNKTTSECQKCPEYTFNNFPGEERCFDCMSWTENRQSCEKTRSNSTSCPNLCKTSPGYQVIGIGSKNLEPCPKGYFNNDADQMGCRECGALSSTSSIGSVNSSQCTLCNFRYTGSKCQYCVPGFQTTYPDGVCAKQHGVLIFLRVVLSIQGKADKNIVSHIQHAFSVTFNISTSLFIHMHEVQVHRRFLLHDNQTIHISLEIQTEDAQADALQRKIVTGDMKSLNLYEGLSTVNITVVSVDFITKISIISHNTSIISFVVIVAICIASLLCLFVLYKFWSNRQSPEAANSNIITSFAGIMGTKFKNKEKSYAPI